MAPGAGGAMAPKKYTPAEIAALAHIGGWTGHDQIVTATAIALAESGGVQARSVHKNKNGTYDWGVWQINDVHKPSDDVKNYGIDNAKAGYRVWVEAGHSWKPWATFNDNSYRAHLATAEQAYNTIQSDTSIEQRLRSADRTHLDAGATGTNRVDDGFGISNPLDGINNTIANAFSALTKSLFGVALNAGVLVLAIVLIILAVVVLARGPATSVLKKTPIGRVAKVVKS